MRRLFLPAAAAILVVYGFVAARAWRALELEIGAEAEAAGEARRSAASRIREAAREDFLGFIEAENDRPFYDYNFFYVPEDLTGMGRSVLRSPLADTGEYTYGFSFFQVDGRGRLTTPLHNDELPGEDEWEYAETEAEHLRSSVLDLVLDEVMIPERTEYALVPLSELRAARASASSEPRFRPAPVAPGGRVVAQQAINIENNFAGNELFLEQTALPARAGPPPGRIVFSEIPDEPTPDEMTEVRYSPFYVVGGGTLPHVFVRRVEMRDHLFVDGFLLDTGYLYSRLSSLAEERTGEDLVFGIGEGEYRVDYPFGSVGFSLIEPPDEAAARERKEDSRRLLHGLLTGGGGILAAGCLSLFYLLILRAEELSRRKDDFISAVSHELRTPLAGILMYAEMLDEGWVSDDKKRSTYLGRILGEGRRLSRLVERILDFSRLNRGEERLSISPNNLDEAVEEALSALAPRLSAEGFKVERSVDPVEFSFDRDALIRVIHNLVENSMKFSGERREISISARSLDEKVVVEVADRGKGVDEGECSRIFEPFYRSGSELTRTAPGTGIGLALVKSIAEAHGGSAEARPNPGGGLIVSVVLPARRG